MVGLPALLEEAVVAWRMGEVACALRCVLQADDMLDFLYEFFKGEPGLVRREHHMVLGCLAAVWHRRASRAAVPLRSHSGCAQEHQRWHMPPHTQQKLTNHARMPHTPCTRSQRTRSSRARRCT